MKTSVSDISEERLISERNRLLYDALPAAAAASLILAVLLVVVQRHVVGWTLSLAWLAISALIAVGRLFLLRTYSRDKAAVPASVFERRFMLGAAAAGASWGLASVMLFPQDPTHRVFLAFVLAGLSAGAVSSLGASFTSARWFLSLSLVPLIIRMAVAGGFMPLMMASMTLLFLFFLLFSCRRIAGTLRENSTLRFHVEAREEIERVQSGLLRESTQHLSSAVAMKQAVMDASNYAIIATDTDGRIHTFSNGAARMLRFDARDVVGKKSLHSLYAPDLEDPGHRIESVPATDFLANALSHENGSEERDVTWVRRDGTHIPVHVALSAVHDETGGLIGYVAIAGDITERRRVDALKDEFISTVSHELRTPLTSIHASLGLITSGAAGQLPERVHRMLDIAARNSKRLISLINDILDIEKLESGHLDVTTQRQPLAPLIRQAIEITDPFARELDIALQFESALDADVVVDGDRLIQVFVNLISNAVKFSPKGESVRIAVRVTDIAATISVSDNGPGIAPEFVPRLFDKFTQADSSDRRQKGGTGLGLAISRAIIERMGGRISVETSAVTGSTFSVTLPLTTAPA